VNAPCILGLGEREVQEVVCIDCSWIYRLFIGNLLFTFFYEQDLKSMNYKSEEGREEFAGAYSVSVVDLADPRY
jgi:hypothetical protein